MKKVQVILFAGAIVFAAGQLRAQEVSSDPNQVAAMQSSHPAGSQTPSASSQNSAAAPGEVGRAMQDKMFLRHAIAGSMAQVKMGQLALAKSNNTDVKQFAQKMVTDHNALVEAMKPVAEAANVNQPKKLMKKDQETYDKLSQLSDTDFDHEYIAAMVADHHKDKKEFDEEAERVVNPNVKQVVENTAKVIDEHTILVDELARKNGVTATIK